MTVAGVSANQAIESSTEQAAVPCRAYNRKFLRIVSLVFALMLAFFCVGVGGRIYMDRAISGMIDQSDIHLTGEHRQVLTQWLAGIARQDVQAVRFAEVDMEKLNAEYRFSPDGSIFIITEVDPDKAYDYSISEAKTKASKKDDLALFNSVAKGIYGSKWSMMRLAGYYWIFMVAGGVLALAALILWFAKGGRPSNVSDTAMIPLGAVIFGVGIAFIVAFSLVSADFTAGLRVVISNAGVGLTR